MGLDLPSGIPTGHITWAARGWEHPVSAHTPVTAPGALEGWRFSDVFRRRDDGREHGYSVHGIVAPPGPQNPFHAAWRAIWAAGPQVRTSTGMFSCWGHGMRILDGRVSYDAADYGFSGSPSMFITGTRTIRLFANRLGLRPPRLLTGERSIPTSPELEQELLAQLREALGPDVGTVPLEQVVPRVGHDTREPRRAG